MMNGEPENSLPAPSPFCPIHELSLLNLHPNVLNWIVSYLSNGDQRATVNDSLCRSLPISLGAPQGFYSWNPFLIFINDFPDAVASCIMLFTDDCVLFCATRCHSDQMSLRQNLLSIFDWCLFDVFL